MFFASFLEIFFNLLSLFILARVLLSWMQGIKDHPVVSFIHDTTDPVLNLAKKITPRAGMLDLSPLIAMVGLDILKTVLLSFF
jgi:YggT family protein